MRTESSSQLPPTNIRPPRARPGARHLRGAALLLFATTAWAQLDSFPGSATDVAVNARGDFYVLGTAPCVDGAGCAPYRWDGRNFVQMPGHGDRIAVDPTGRLWMVNKQRNIYRYSENSTNAVFVQMPGQATDIGIGADGTVVIIGVTECDTNGCRPERLVNNQFVPFAGRGVRVAVGPTGLPTLVNKNNGIYSYINGQDSNQLPGAATDVGVASDGTVYVIGTTPCNAYGCGIYKNNGRSFDLVPGLFGTSVTAGAGGVVWTGGLTNAITRFSPALPCTLAVVTTSIGLPALRTLATVLRAEIIASPAGCSANWTATGPPGFDLSPGAGSGAGSVQVVIPPDAQLPQTITVAGRTITFTADPALCLVGSMKADNTFFYSGYSFKPNTAQTITARGRVSLARDDIYETDANGTILRAPSAGTGAANFFTFNASPVGTPPRVGETKTPLTAPENIAPYGALLAGFSASQTTGPATWIKLGTGARLVPADQNALNLWLKVNDIATGLADNSGSFLLSIGCPVPVQGDCTATLGQPGDVAPDAQGRFTFDLSLGATCRWTLEGLPAGWTASANSGTGPQRITITPTPNTNTQPLTTTLTVAGLTVKLVQPGNVAPSVSISSVVNAASYAGGGIAPGEIVTIFGTRLGPAALRGLELNAARTLVTNSVAGTRILFNGVAAPIIYTSEKQVSVIVPYGVAGQRSVEVVAEFEGNRSAPLTVNVVSAQPGLFTLNSSGTGAGAILNSDYRLNGPGNRVARGRIVLLYATGEGRPIIAVQDGAVVSNVVPKPSGTVAVTIGGVPSEVLYAGGVVGLVAGVMQLNILVPASAPVGDEVEVILTVAGVSSRSGVTLSIAP